MSFPLSPGHPNYSSSGTSDFIPEVWSGKMQVKFYDYTCITQITNTNWEGEIKNFGDKVFIRSIPNITMNRGYHAGKLLNYESPESPSITLFIDKGVDWGIRLDDVMRVQADLPLLDKWTTGAAEDLKVAVETDFFSDSTIYDGCHASNKGLTAGAKSGSYNMGATGAPIQVTKANVLELIVDCGSVLNEAKIPKTGRWMVIPSWFENMIKKSDIKDASLTGDQKSTLRNGRIGGIDYFTLYSSDLLYSTTDVGTCYTVLFGSMDAISFAGQITETEKIRHPFAFADVVRGLKIYGYKATKPEAYGVLYCKK